MRLPLLLLLPLLPTRCCFYCCNYCYRLDCVLLLPALRPASTQPQSLLKGIQSTRHASHFITSVLKPESMSPKAPAPKAPVPPRRGSVPSAAEASVVPAKKPRTEEPTRASTGAPPALPQIPKDEQASARDTMSVLIPWTQYALKEFLAKHRDDFPGFPAVDIYMHQPLDIKGTSADPVELRSYKAPWSANSCRLAIDDTNMYEAAANIAWVHAFPGSATEQIIAGDPVLWGHVVEVAEVAFSRAASQGSSAWRGSGQFIDRIIFPITLHAHAKEGVNIDAQAFNGSLDLISGHSYLYGWWYAMFEALRKEDLTLVASLWQCGLTVSVQLRRGLDNAKMAVLSCGVSERNKTNERIMSDSFPAFAQKVLVVVPRGSETNRIQKLKDLQVRFKNAPVNKAMLSSILLFEHKIDEFCLRLLRDIERVSGRDTLSGGYSKLHRLVTVCSKEAEGTGDSVSAYVRYVLEYLRFALKFEQIDAKAITVDWIDKSKDGTPGAVQTVLARRSLVGFVGGLVQDLHAAEVAPAVLKELDDILPYFANPSTYEAAFQAPASTEVDVYADAQADTQEVDLADQTDLLEQCKNKYANKISHLLLDFGYDLMAGCYDDVLKKALASKASLREIAWAEVDLDSLREVMRNLNLHKNVVGISKQSSAPMASTRTLQRYGSEASAEDAERRALMMKERQDVWRQAQVQRKKFVTVGHAKCATKAQAQQYFEKCSSVYSFVGRVGDQHRVFLFSAELFQECRNAPWSNLAEYDKAALPLLEFMLAQTGPGDVLVFLDGRSKSWRKELEKITEKARHLNEVWIIFQHTPRLGRKVSFASDNKEVALLSMPVARTLLTCKDRSEYTAAGENSTHDSTYTGVEPMPWSAMPMVSTTDKTQIHGFQPPDPRAKLFDVSMGQPLYWQERKSPKFWRTLLSHLDAKAVFDCTPGAGSAGRAAMEMGIVYACMAKNADHNSWLQNVFDRSAMAIVTRSGTPLFEQDLATCVTEHFKDVLDQLHQQDACEDKAPEEDME